MTQSNDTLPTELQLVFQPLHKRALGMALGVASGLVVFGMTAIVLLRRPDPAPNIWILREYFYGYTVSWAGALVGFAWGFVAGFTAGWFIAFCRNLVLAASIWLTRTRVELSASRDFLDHI
jgi:hypothetical protein